MKKATKMLKGASHVRIQFTSNLFIDQHAIPFHKLLRPDSKSGILALLGNIGRADNPKTYHFMSYCARNWDTVLWVLGPHEITNDPGHEKLYYERIDECYQLSSHFNKRVLLLNQNEYNIPESNLIIAGSTLWTANRIAMPSQPEYREVYVSTAESSCTTATPEIYMSWHRDDFNYIMNLANSSSEKSLVLLTHHLPVPCLINRDLRKLTYYRMGLDVNNLQSKMHNSQYAWLSGATGSCNSGMFGTDPSRQTYYAVNSCFEYPYLSTMKPNKHYSPTGFVELKSLS